VVIDVENEDPEVEWIPAPNYVAVVIANEDATPLLQDDIAAINVAPEFDVSSDEGFPFYPPRGYLKPGVWQRLISICPRHKERPPLVPKKQGEKPTMLPEVHILLIAPKEKHDFSSNRP
jgi:hypothetical protein